MHSKNKHFSSVLLNEDEIFSSAADSSKLAMSWPVLQSVCHVKPQQIGIHVNVLRKQNVDPAFLCSMKRAFERTIACSNRCLGQFFWGVHSQQSYLKWYEMKRFKLQNRQRTEMKVVWTYCSFYSFYELFLHPNLFLDGLMSVQGSPNIRWNFWLAFRCRETLDILISNKGTLDSGQVSNHPQTSRICQARSKWQFGACKMGSTKYENLSLLTKSVSREGASTPSETLTLDWLFDGLELTINTTDIAWLLIDVLFCHHWYFNQSTQQVQGQPIDNGLIDWLWWSLLVWIAFL